jgi:hypothetical protein
MRLWSDCSHMKTKVAATNACGNTQLCAGLGSGIEANLHAVRAIWPQSAGWTEDGTLEEEDDGDPSSGTNLRRRIQAEGVLAPGTDPGAAEDATFSRYELGTGFGSALFDARNGFNEINRYLMLWNVAHRWNLELGEQIRVQQVPALGPLPGPVRAGRTSPRDPLKGGDHAGRLPRDEPIRRRADAPRIQDACGNPRGLATVVLR